MQKIPKTVSQNILSVLCIEADHHLGFSKIQAELTNLPILPNLPNCAKIKNPLNVFKLKFSNFISFWNTSILSEAHVKLSLMYLV